MGVRGSVWPLALLILQLLGLVGCREMLGLIVHSELGSVVKSVINLGSSGDISGHGLAAAIGADGATLMIARDASLTDR